MSVFQFSVQPLGFLSWGIVVTLISLLAFAVQVAFGVGIYRDGIQLQAVRRLTLFVPPWAWGVTATLGGFPVVALYWLIHHSTFGRMSVPVIETNQSVEKE